MSRNIEQGKLLADINVPNIELPSTEINPPKIEGNIKIPTIEIPKINLSYPILEKVTDKTLKLAVAIEWPQPDPVLNEIDFSNENNWMVQLINTPEFKRLNRIHQLGVTYIIFPTATHNRLSHSLGAFEIVRRFIKHLHLDKLEPRESQHLLCAALLHDLGHGPNSHAFERYTGTNHEEYTKKFILDKSTNINKILLKHGINPKEVVDILNQKTNKLWATALIDSQIDGDRMDYLLRDSKYTGASYGVINPTYIINGSVLINNRICFSMKTLTEIENLLLGRFHMYKQIYSNPNSVKYEFVIQQIFLRIKYLYKTGYKFTNKYR